MTIPAVSQPGTGPDRVNAPADYDVQTTAYRIAYNISVGEINTAITAMNLLGDTVDGDATAAEAARAQAVAKAAEALASADNAAESEGQVELMEASVVAATGLDVSAFNIGDLLQVIDDGAGGKELAMSAQRLENSVAFSGATPSLNIANDQCHHGTLTGATTFTFNVADFGTIANSAIFFVLEITQDSTLRTITFPASVEWDGAIAPDAPAVNAKAAYTFASRDGGTTWLGSQYGAAFA